MGDGFVGRRHVLILDKVAELGVGIVADGSLEVDGLAAGAEHPADAFGGHVHGFGDLFGGGLAAEVLFHLLGDLVELADAAAEMGGDADGAAVVGEGAGDGLADPPGGVGTKAVSAAIVVFLDGLDEADVAFLDEIEEGEAAAAVFFGDGDDEAGVGADEVGAGGEAELDGVVGVVGVEGVVGSAIDLEGDGFAVFDAFGEGHFLFGGEE